MAKKIDKAADYLTEVKENVTASAKDTVNTLNTTVRA